MNELFFELIQVAIGTQYSLSHTPSVDEWGELYAMAKKQSLVGVCFAGVQKFQTQRQEPPEMLYLTWMGMAAKIQQRNEQVSRMCLEQQAKLKADGYDPVILKGQGIAQLYDPSLRGLRQSGDVDVWLRRADGQEVTIKSIVKYISHFNKEYEAKKAHVEFETFGGISIELHPIPAFVRCPWYNCRLQKWIKSMSNSTIMLGGMNIPSYDFNVIYLLLHMYNHFLFEGVGMRQMCDYYFCLKSACVNDKSNIIKQIHRLGLQPFAGGVMWIMCEVFKIDETYLLCKPDRKNGEVILQEVLKGGNFGKYNEEQQRGDSLFIHGLWGLKRKISFWRLGKWEILCSPFWSIYQVSWRLLNGYM